jgi:hypothetical protein
MYEPTLRFHQLQIDDRLCEWLDGPQERQLRQKMRQLSLRVDLSPPWPSYKSPPQQSHKRQRKKGGGRKLSLTPRQIAAGQTLFRRALRKNLLLEKADAAVEYLGPRLKRFGVSEPTLLRHIIRPVLRQNKLAGEAK